MKLNAEAINDLINGDENRRALESARNLLHSRRCILFAGAGTSKPAGYPLWGELLDEMQGFFSTRGINDPRSDRKDLLRSANELYESFRQNDLLESHYYALLYNRFAPIEGQSLKLQRTILTLPFCGIATTNWDICFESALREGSPSTVGTISSFSIHKDHPHTVRRYFDSLWLETKGAKSVAHLHGIYDDAKDIIITAEQYAEAYGGSYVQIGKADSGKKAPERWTLLRRTVWALMATQRLIFVGFGMNDPFVYALLSYVSGDLWDKTGQVHYFITGISDSTQQDPYARRRRLQDDLGVQTIFYEVQDNDHSRLTDLLYDLGADPSSETHNQPLISELLGPI